MVRRESEIKFLSPSYHAFLADLLRAIYAARMKRDLEVLVENMKFLYLSLPSIVKQETDEVIRGILEDIRGKDPVISSLLPNKDGPITLYMLDSIINYCREHVSKYKPGQTVSEKYSRCFSIVLPYIDLVYNHIITSAHKHNVFAVSRTYWRGEGG